MKWIIPREIQSTKIDPTGDRMFKHREIDNYQATTQNTNKQKEPVPDGVTGILLNLQ